MKSHENEKSMKSHEQSPCFLVKSPFSHGFNTLQHWTPEVQPAPPKTLRSSHRLGDRLDASVQGGGLWGWSPTKNTSLGAEDFGETGRKISAKFPGNINLINHWFNKSSIGNLFIGLPFTMVYQSLEAPFTQDMDVF